MTDAELVSCSRFQDRTWLAELFSRYEGRLTGCAHRMAAPSEVEDAAQKINERILKGLSGFRGDSAVGTWISSVARNSCLDVRRRRKPTAYDSQAILDSVPSDEEPEDLFDISILGCRTTLALRQLPEGQAAVVMLRLSEGLSTADTAKRLSITEDAVKAKLRRARKQLRFALAEEIACPNCGPGTYSVAGARIAT